MKLSAPAGEHDSRFVEHLGSDLRSHNTLSATSFVNCCTDIADLEELRDVQESREFLFFIPGMLDSESFEFVDFFVCFPSCVERRPIWIG